MTMEGECSGPSPAAVETIFTAASALPPDQRPSYLAGACGADARLRQRVEALLRAQEAPKRFLPEKPGVAAASAPLLPTAVAAASAEQPGDLIGRYKLLQKIGEGGCGVVYMAEQEEPVRRKVALKVIKLGMDTRQVVARFEGERQALALMDHANIAKVLEAGATEAGRPYFVMELVGGIKITDYCDQNHLSTRQRLDLFIQVCRAIQHAHQKGIIHRDIKPSNVLVATQDGTAAPKVIDFGIAKATQGKLTDQTVFTAFEQFLGTPAYMSPEQAQLGGLDVDTRSDIYSLGVLLYELLTGKTPFDTREMLAGGLDAMRRTIQEKEPPTPSTRLKQELVAADVRRLQSLAPDAPGIEEPVTASSRRLLQSRELLKALQGDLDWIVMKCLEKDRARRYETANGLARDIERHLNNEPILARPPSRLYEFQKTVRRHKFGFAATATVIAALSCGVVATSFQAFRAQRAEREQSRLRQEAQAARQDATEKLWASYLAEARALRMSGQAGRQFGSLAALQKAAAIRPALALRNEAIAAMVLPDLQRVGGKDFTKTRQSVCVDPTFERYALCEKTGAVSVRRIADDSELMRLPAVGPAATGCMFSPDGKFLSVAYSGGWWRVWDWAKPAIAIAREIPLEIPVLMAGVGFAPDSRTFGVSDATNIVLHDLVGGQKPSSISLNGLASTRAPGWFRFAPTGQRLALYSTEAETNVCIMDTLTGQALKTLQHAHQVWEVAWHPDGRRLATGCLDKSIHIWDTISGERLQMWRTESSVSLGFSHQGNVLASSGWDAYTRLWDFSSGRQVSSFPTSGHILGFAPNDQRMATDGWDGIMLEFLDVALGRGLRALYEAPEVSNSGGWPIMDLKGRLLVFRTQAGIELWDVQTVQQISALELDKRTSPVGFDPDDQNLILTGSQGLFRCPIVKSGGGVVCNIGEPTLVSTECADPAGGRTGRISASGKICAIVGNDRCQFFRTDTFEKQAETDKQLGMRYSDINWDGSLFASGAWHYGGVRVWDAQTGGLIAKLLTEDEHRDLSATVSFSPDGRRLVTATKYEYVFWEVGSWSLAHRIPQPEGNDFCPMMSFTPDGRILAGTHSRNKVRLHDAATGQVLAHLEAPNSRMITGLAFDRDGTRLFASELADALRVWDLRQIREKLAELGLDWDQPPYPVAEPGPGTQSKRSADRTTSPMTAGQR